MKGNKENKEKMSGNQKKQEITIPFLWEEKPGATKESWKTPKREPLTPVHRPVKYIASVPFIWEEKPGTPLRCFAQEANEQVTKIENKSLPLPPAYYGKYGNESEGDGDGSYGDSNEYEDWLSELDFEALSVVSEESFRSAPSPLQAKWHPPSMVAPCSGFVEGSSSSESSSSPSSTSRKERLRGGSFVQQLFPLYPPKSGFLDKFDNSEKTNGDVQYNNERRLPTLEEYKRFNAEFRRIGVIRKQMTLGELIMQSRRRSYRRHTLQIKRNSPVKVREWQDSNDEKPQGCINLGARGAGLTKVTKLLGKDLLPLKLA